MKPLHVDLILLLEPANHIEGSKVKFPAQNPSEFLLRFTWLHTVKFLHVKLSKDIYSKLDLRSQVAADGWVVVAPVASGEDLDRDLKGDLPSIRVFLKFRVELKGDLDIFEHGVHLLGVLRTALLLQSLDKLLLCLVIETQIVEQSLAKSVSVKVFKLIFVGDESKDLNTLVYLSNNGHIIHAFDFSPEELINVLSKDDGNGILAIDEVFKGALNGQRDAVVFIAGEIHKVRVLSPHVDQGLHHFFLIIRF